MAEIGLFPLPMVLLPTEQVPLHIFEDRYKDLVEECLSEDRSFGLVYAEEEGIHDIGTEAVVTEVLTRFDDGRLNVLVEGRERFRLVELTSGRSFQTGRILPVLDEEDAPDPHAVRRALELFEHLRELTGSEVEAPSEDSPRLSYALASRVELESEVKQALLQETSERVRLDRVCDLLVEAYATVELHRRAAERALTNGRVDLS